MKKFVNALVIVLALFIGAPLLIISILGMFGVLDKTPPVHGQTATRSSAIGESDPARTNDTNSGAVVLTAANNANILIWKDYNSLTEAMTLLNAGVHKTHPELLAVLISCRTMDGSQAVVTNGGLFSSDVIVISGRASGCRGTIDNANIRRPH